MLTRCLARISFFLALAGPALGQMTMPTTGVLPSSPLDHSVILGDDLAQFQARWTTPANALDQSWVSSIQSYANQSVGVEAPATFTSAVIDSRTAESAGLRYAMTGASADLSKAVAALLQLDIPANNGNDFITHPEVMTSYLLAYDFIRGAPLNELSASTRATIESRLLSETQQLSNGNDTLSNARGKIGATRALAGVLLGDQTLLDTGLSDLNAHFGYSTTNDGWFTDSQGHYLNYTLRHLGAFVRAYEQGSGVDLYANVQPFVDLTVALRLPDGTVPNVSNGLVLPVGINLFTQSTDPQTASKALWYLQTAPNLWGSTNIQNNDNSFASLFALTDWHDVTPQAPTESPTYLAQGQSKISVFRQDWSTGSDYLLLSPGIDSPGFIFPPYSLPAFHSHNDTGEILVASKGKYILVAPGYQRTDLSNSPPNHSTQGYDQHNIILVNGEMGFMNEGRTRRPEDFVHTERLDSTEFGGFKGVSDFSTLRYSYYGGTDLARSIAFPHEEYFVVADRMNSAVTNTYGFNLIGRGTRTTLTNTASLIEVKWEFEGAQVIEHLVGTHPLSLVADTTFMHVEFNDYEVTQRIRANMTTDNGSFLSIIETGAAGDPSALVVTNLSTGTLAAARVYHSVAGTIDRYFAQSSSQWADVERLGSDGTFAMAREQAGALKSLMIASATRLEWDHATVLRASDRVTLSLLLDGAEWRGTLSADDFVAGTELELPGVATITSATLNGTPISFVNDPGVGILTLPGSGSLVVQFASVPEATSLLLTAGFFVGCGWWNRRRRIASERGL